MTQTFLQQSNKSTRVPYDIVVNKLMTQIPSYWIVGLKLNLVF